MKNNGCGKYIGNWRCGTIFSEKGKKDKMFLCPKCSEELTEVEDES